MESTDLYGKCPYVTTQRIISGKWTILILQYLRESTLRFGELQRKLPDLTQSTLSKQLRQLEEYGLILRKVYPEVPPKVEYSLSDLGKEFQPVLDALEIFGEKFIQNKKN